MWHSTCNGSHGLRNEIGPGFFGTQRHPLAIWNALKVHIAANSIFGTSFDINCDWESVLGNISLLRNVCMSLFSACVQCERGRN